VGHPNNCTFPGVIVPGAACRMHVTNGENVTGAALLGIRCVIVTKGSAKSLRGTLRIREVEAPSARILEAR
jgi:hypothetical protein